MFYSKENLNKIGFKKVGTHVLISDKCSIYNPENIEIGDNVRVDDFCIISAGDGGITIGNHVHIACYVSLIGKALIEVCDFAGISSRSAIYSSTDDYSGNFLTGPTIPEEFTNVSHERVHIGKHCILGVNTVVMPGVKINEGAATGVFSLVKKDVEAFTIVAGTPLKILKKRNKKLLELEWKLKRK
tara:strand:+ start:689 stop:1246 length:558 start_codon:yes stop_codon:yes gene_type:complete